MARSRVYLRPLALGRRGRGVARRRPGARMAGVAPDDPRPHRSGSRTVIHCEPTVTAGTSTRLAAIWLPFAATLVLARDACVRSWEQATNRRLNGLPDVLHYPLWVVMQCGTAGAPAVAGGQALAAGRPASAGRLTTYGMARTCSPRPSNASWAAADPVISSPASSSVTGDGATVGVQQAAVPGLTASKLFAIGMGVLIAGIMSARVGVLPSVIGARVRVQPSPPSDSQNNMQPKQRDCT